MRYWAAENVARSQGGEAHRREKMDHTHAQHNIPQEQAPLETHQPAPQQTGMQTQAGQDEHGVRQTFHCANCEIEFFWPPTRVQDRVYCCTGCAAGGPCNCDYSLHLVDS